MIESIFKKNILSLISEADNKIILRDKVRLPDKLVEIVLERYNKKLQIFFGNILMKYIDELGETEYAIKRIEYYTLHSLDDLEWFLKHPKMPLLPKQIKKNWVDTDMGARNIEQQLLYILKKYKIILEYSEYTGESYKNHPLTKISQIAEMWKSGTNVIHEFKDGYYWVDLMKKVCEMEGEKMGHCGKTDKGETLLSLRDSDGEPHITVAYSYNGTYYQMKGKRNKHPDEEYWDYCMWLFDHKELINGELQTSYSDEQTAKRYKITNRAQEYDGGSDFIITDYNSVNPERVDTILSKNHEKLASITMVMREKVKRANSFDDIFDGSTNEVKSYSYSNGEYLYVDGSFILYSLRESYIDKRYLSQNDSYNWRALFEFLFDLNVDKWSKIRDSDYYSKNINENDFRIIIDHFDSYLPYLESVAKEYGGFENRNIIKDLRSLFFSKMMTEKKYLEYAFSIDSPRDFFNLFKITDRFVMNLYEEKRYDYDDNKYGSIDIDKIISYPIIQIIKKVASFAKFYMCYIIVKDNEDGGFILEGENGISIPIYVKKISNRTAKKVSDDKLSEDMNRLSNVEYPMLGTIEKLDSQYRQFIKFEDFKELMAKKENKIFKSLGTMKPYLFFTPPDFLSDIFDNHTLVDYEDEGGVPDEDVDYGNDYDDGDDEDDNGGDIDYRFLFTPKKISPEIKDIYKIYTNSDLMEMNIFEYLDYIEL